jgi:hypothetical protein
MRPVPTGGTLRANLERAAAQGSRKAATRLAAIPPLPRQLAHVWDWWGEISAGRRVGMDGAEWLAWSDIDAWSRLTGERPRPDEARLIFALDREWRAARAACTTEG